MMRRFLSVVFVFMTAVVASCGGSDNTLVNTTPPPTGGVPPVDVSSLSVLTSSPNIPSDGALPATITALVRDANNNVVEGVPVLFGADSGGLAVTEPMTNPSGFATAELSTAGDPANRTISVTAEAGGLVGTVAVDVVGTQLVISGPSSLVQNDMATYTIVLSNAAGDGIPSQTVDVSSANGNTLAAATLTTDAAGQAQVEVTASAAGDDTLTATALGIDTTLALNVSNDSFSFVVPDQDTEIVLNDLQTVTVTWQVAGVPQPNEAISFSTTRGVLTALTDNTNALGEATVAISSANAGPAVVTATTPDGTATLLSLEFVATVADTIEVQADPFTIAPNEQSAITAIVRDPLNNLVKNKTIVFVLDDVTGGVLSVASAVTDSQGRAQTFYTASNSTSASEGVVVTATVQDTPAVFDSAALTVAQREVFISMGTGNEIFEPNSAQYRKEFLVIVTDADGNGVEGVNVQLSILSDFYRKGFWALPLTGGWIQQITTPIENCPDEDINRNGVLDMGEDLNNSGLIEAGNVATVTVQAGGGGTLITDANGLGLVDVIYAQDFAQWVFVALQARTDVQGTEFTETNRFWLDIAANDVNNRDATPPGQPSPYGVSMLCSDTD